MELFLGLLYLAYMIGGFSFVIFAASKLLDDKVIPTNGDVVLLVFFLPQTIVVGIITLIAIVINKIFTLMKEHSPQIIVWWKKPIRKEK